MNHVLLRLKRADGVQVALAALALAAALAALALWPRAPQALCGGRRYALAAVAGGAAPYVRLSAGAVAGDFLIDYGATQSSASAAAFGGPAGAVKIIDLSLPGVGGAPFVLRAFGMPLAPSGGEVGVIGTDFLSRVSAQFAPGAVFIGARCDADALRAYGLAAVSQRGFFGDESTLNDDHNPNVPVVFVNVGGVRAVAQVDTGYDDILYSRSVDINAPMYDRIVASGAALQPVGGVDVATCSGRESRPVYALRSPLAIETGEGAPIMRVDGVHLIVKRANGCGGIATMAAPAAQLGASFLKEFDPIVFDPANQMLWLKPAGARR